MGASDRWTNGIRPADAWAVCKGIVEGAVDPAGMARATVHALAEADVLTHGTLEVSDADARKLHKLQEKLRDAARQTFEADTPSS